MVSAAVGSSPTEYIKWPNANGILIEVVTCEYAQWLVAMVASKMVSCAT